MDEQMKERLAESLDKVASYVEQGADFAIEQAPLVAQEIVRWQMTVGLLWAVPIFLLGLALLGFSVAVFREERRAGSPEYEAVVGLAGFGLAFIGLGMIPFAFAMKALAAPRLVVLEKLGELIR